jgi:hypothetical protein
MPVTEAITAAVTVEEEEIIPGAGIEEVTEEVK